MIRDDRPAVQDAGRATSGSPRPPGLLGAALVLLALAVLPGTPAASHAEPGVGLRKVADTSALGDPLGFEVVPGGNPLVLTRENVFDAVTGKPLFGAPLADPAALAFAGGKLRLLSGGALSVVEGGISRRLLEVPLARSVFVSDGERSFIGGVSASGKPLLYVHQEGSGYKPLLELDAPIDAMALAGGTLFFSRGSGIYTLREGGPARLLARLPGFPRIPSLAADDRNGALYFSDGERLHVIRGKDIGVVRHAAGGLLRWRDGVLYVLSGRYRALFRVEGLPEALTAAGALVPLDAGCRPPVLSMYCEAEERRAMLRKLAELEESLDPADSATRGELAAGIAGQKTAYERARAGLGREAEAGAQAVLWGGDLVPAALRAGTQVAGGAKGIGLTLWDGSGIRIGPDSRAALDSCGPSGPCRVTLEKGLLYFEGYEPPVEGMPEAGDREYAVGAGALRVGFGPARLALFASEERVALVVLEGRVKVAAPGSDAVTVLAGETLEVARGERPGDPVPADLDRLNPWWEEIR
jgi:ferric-dicitrate binding protein FerR (iron transport regulator)